MPLTTSYNYPNTVLVINDGLIAQPGGGQPNATLASPTHSLFTTVGTAADSAQLPPSAANRAVDVTNMTATSMRLFVHSSEPATTLFAVPSGSVFTGGANFIDIAAGVTAHCVSSAAGVWKTIN